MSKINDARVQTTALNDKLIITARVLEHTIDILFGQFGITARTYEILIRIHSGENTTTRLASVMQSSPANITHKTKLLEKQRRIKRLADHKDKRIWYFSLTPQGKKLLNAIRFLYEKATEKLYDQFSEQEKEHALEFLNAIEKHLKAIMENKGRVKAFADSQVKIKK